MLDQQDLEDAGLALIRWFDSQEIPRRDSVELMAWLSGHFAAAEAMNPICVMNQFLYIYNEAQAWKRDRAIK